MSNILAVEDIHTYYGQSYVLQGLTLKVITGRVAALMGRNGTGKTTTMRSVMGFTPIRRGRIRFKDEDITKLNTYEIARRGVRLVPQGRHIFPSLSVKENLAIAARQCGEKQTWNSEKVLSLFQG